MTMGMASSSSPPQVYDKSWPVLLVSVCPLCLLSARNHPKKKKKTAPMTPSCRQASWACWLASKDHGPCDPALQTPPAGGVHARAEIGMYCMSSRPPASRQPPACGPPPLSSGMWACVRCSARTRAVAPSPEIDFVWQKSGFLRNLICLARR